MALQAKKSGPSGHGSWALAQGAGVAGVALQAKKSGPSGHGSWAPAQGAGVALQAEMSGLLPKTPEELAWPCRP